MYGLGVLGLLGAFRNDDRFKCLNIVDRLKIDNVTRR